MHHIFRTMFENLNANFKQNAINIRSQSIQCLSYDLGDQGVRVRLAAGARSLFFSVTFRPALKPIHTPTQWVQGGVPWGYRGRSVKLTTHLHLVSRLGMVELLYISTPHTGLQSGLINKLSTE
jgi:hypothetical protein